MVVAEEWPDIYTVLLIPDDGHVCEGVLRLYDRVLERADRGWFAAITPDDCKSQDCPCIDVCTLPNPCQKSRNLHVVIFATNKTLLYARSMRFLDAGAAIENC
jgi:hypothetical protein